MAGRIILKDCMTSTQSNITESRRRRSLGDVLSPSVCDRLGYSAAKRMERCQDEPVYEGVYEEPFFSNIASFRAHYGSCYEYSVKEEI